ncbi:hypothetical protein CANINC_002681 [Pichia inconspicua]|uniref:Allantoin permease n=1 Tax=Pichia inconspicua TaxID=52247 RepID=A0A4T0X0P6_9ASCO|nr:hypothetical protein CANINC_002681 [[Candida] inconspicua]
MGWFEKLDQKISLYNTDEKEYGIRSNKDLDPTNVEDRTWRTYNYFLVWFQSSLNVTIWNSGASLIKNTGITYWKTMIASVVATLIGGLFVMINSRGGAVYHVGYPVLLRSVFGVWGYYFFVIVRGFVAILWFAVQTYYGGCLLDVVLRCIFGHKWYDIPNHIPADQGITTRLMVAFFLFWLCQWPVIVIHPTKIRHFFTFKAFALPWATLGIFIYCCVVGKGPGNWDLGIPIKTESAQVGWSFMMCINAILGSISAMIINQPDVARYAKKPSAPLWPQFAGFMLSKVAIQLFAMVAVASYYRVSGVAYWSLWDLLNAILDEHWTAGARTGVCLVAGAFCIGNMGTNLFGNALPFAADLTGLFPKYINILRGQILIATICWGIVPWKMLKNAATFLTFLGSYTAFVGPILGCMLADYYFVRKGNYHTPSLYTRNPDGIYYFYKGVNWWGCLAWAMAMALGIPGLAAAIHPEKYPAACLHMNYIGWLMCTIAAMVFYTVFAKIFNPRIYPEGHEDTPTTFEYMRPNNGFFEEDTPINGVGALNYSPTGSSSSIDYGLKEQIAVEVTSIDK